MTLGRLKYGNNKKFTEKAKDLYFNLSANR